MIIKEGYVCTATNNDDGQLVYFYNDNEYSGGFPSKSTWFETNYMLKTREDAESSLKHWYKPAYHDYCSDFRDRHHAVGEKTHR